MKGFVVQYDERTQEGVIQHEEGAHERFEIRYPGLRVGMRVQWNLVQKTGKNPSLIVVNLRSPEEL
jgi:hypothetical protein